MVHLQDKEAVNFCSWVIHSRGVGHHNQLVAEHKLHVFEWMGKQRMQSNTRSFLWSVSAAITQTYLLLLTQGTDLSHREWENVHVLNAYYHYIQPWKDCSPR